MYRTMLLLALLTLAVTPSLAQEAEIVCTSVDIDAAIENARAMLDEAEAALDSDGVAQALSLLVALHNELVTVGAVCHGLNFEGEGRTVVGPVEFPPGYYRATVTSEGDATLEVSVLSGKCDDGNLFLFWDENEASAGAEALFESEGCRAVLEFGYMDAGVSWTLTFELLE